MRFLSIQKIRLAVKQKEDARETFSTMIHNFMFFSEARLRYAADQNQQEASMLLEQAGSMLTKSVMGVATMALTGGASLASIGNVVIKNVAQSSEFQSEFFGKLASWFNNRSIIQEKQAEFTQSLKTLFNSMDCYSELIGKSILVHGMLSRYSNQLILEYKKEKYGPLKKRILSNSEVTASGSSFLSVISSLKKDIVCDYEYISGLVSAAVSDCDTIKKKIANNVNKIKNLKQQISNLSLFHMSKKSDMKMECEMLKDEIEAGYPIADYCADAMMLCQYLCILYLQTAHFALQ